MKRTDRTLPFLSRCFWKVAFNSPQIDRPVVHAVSVGSENDPYIPCRVKICDNLLSDCRNVMGAFRRSQPPAPVNEVEGMVNFSSVGTKSSEDVLELLRILHPEDGGYVTFHARKGVNPFAMVTAFRPDDLGGLFPDEPPPRRLLLDQRNERALAQGQAGRQPECNLARHRLSRRTRSACGRRDWHRKDF